MSSPAAFRSRLRPRDLLVVSLVGIRARRGRSALTAIGIAIGIAALVGVLGISASSKADLIAQIDALGTNLLEVSPGNSFTGSGTSELPEDAVPMIRRIRPVEAVAATASVDGAVRRSDQIPTTETGGISVVAATTDLFTTIGATTAHGTVLNDATAAGPAVVLGAVAAARLGITDVDASPGVVIDDRHYAVVGILDPLPLQPNLDRSVMIGFAQAQTQLDAIDPLTAGTIYVRTAPALVDAVRSVLAATANPEAPGEVQVSRPSDALEAKSAVDANLNALLLGLGGVALLVGGVAIANVMVISVLERRTEIGVRRALGATRNHIRLQFLIESVFLSTIGGVSGIALGAAITVGFASVKGWTFAVPLTGLAACIGAALAVGALAGLYPAARAARVAPSDAVRGG